MRLRLLLAALLLTATSSGAADYVWLASPGTGDVNTAANWNPSGTPASATADNATFNASTVTALSQSANFLVGNLTFSASAPSYSWDIGSFNFNMGQTNGTAKRTITNNSSATQIFNAGTGVFGLNGTLTGPGDFVFNGTINPGNSVANNAAYMVISGSGNYYFNVDSSIHPAGNVNAAGWSATNGGGSTSNQFRNALYFEGSGRVFLGNLGTANKSNFVLDGVDNQFVRLTHNNSLGANVSNSRVNIYGGTTGNGTLELVNNINVARFTFNFEGRSGAVATDPHILNLSGNNSITIGADTNSLSNAVGNWNIQSDSGKLTISLGNVYNTGTGTTTLRLAGAADGQIDGSLVTWTNNSPSLNVLKAGTGTWTLTSIPTSSELSANGSTVQGGPTLNQTSIFTGTMTVTGGTLALAGTTSLSGTTAVDIRSGGIFSVLGLAGSTLTLNPTNVMLQGAGVYAGNLVAGVSNAIAPGDSGAGTLTINGDLTLNGGGSLLLQLSATPTSLGGINDRVAVQSNLSLFGSTIISVTPTGGSLGNGTYTLMTYGGTLTGDASNFSLLGTPNSPRQSFNLSFATPNQINLAVTGAPASLNWVGGVNGNIWVDGLAVTNSVNWTGAPGPTPDNHFYNGDSVTFTTGTSAVAVSGTVNPGNATFSNAIGLNYIISGDAIDVANALTVNGAGNVNFGLSSLTTVTANFSGTGTTTISSGIFTVTGSFTKSGGGTVSFENSFSPLNLPAVVPITGGVLALNRSDDLIVTNAFTGTGTLRKDNVNTVTVSGDNSGFSGTISVTGGVLQVGHASALGGAAASTILASGTTLDLNGFTLPTGTVTLSGTGLPAYGTPIVNNHATLDAFIPNVILTGDTTLGSAIAHGYTIGLGSTGSIQAPLNNNFTLTVDIPHEIDFFIPGDIGVKNIFINYTGSATANVLYIAGGTTLGPNTGTLTLGNSGRLGFYGRNNTAIVGPNEATGIVTKPIVVANTATGGGIEIYRGNMTIDSPVSLNANLELTTYIRDNGTWTLTMTGPITNGTEPGAPAGSLTLHANSNSASRLGTIVFTNDGNTYTGGTIIGGGGGFFGVSLANDRINAVSIGNGGATGSIGPGPITINPANNTLATFLYLNRTGTYIVPSAITLNGNNNVARIDSIANGDVTLSGVISGTGRVQVHAGNLTLSGDNSYTGITEIFSGRLTLTHANAAGDPGTNSTGYLDVYGLINGGGDDTAALQLANNIVLSKTSIFVVGHTTNNENIGPQIINLSGNNEITGNVVVDNNLDSVNQYYTIQSNAGSNLKISGSVIQDHTGTALLTLRGAGTGDISGTITQPATNYFNNSPVTGNVWNLTKLGSGTWTISGTASHTGTTSVEQGTLSITGNASAATGAVFVNGGDGTAGTLKGTGIVGGPVAVTGGSGTNPLPGTLRGGTSIGTLTLNQGFALGAGARLFVEIGGVIPTAAANTGASTDLVNLPNPLRNSFLHVTGGLVGIDSGALIAVDGTAATFLPGTSYSFLVADGTGAQSFAINNASQFTFTGINVNPSSVSLTGDLGGNVYLNFSTTAIPEPAWLLAGLTLAALFRRRR